MKDRAKNLNDATIETIVEILDGWSGKLTWDAFVAEVAHRTGFHYTRQALHVHVRIQDAFSLCKERVRRESDEQDAPKPDMPPELKVALDVIQRLENENARLKHENSALLEQFARWTYNALSRDLSEAFLNQPLPPVDREQTRDRHPGDAT